MHAIINGRSFVALLGFMAALGSGCQTSGVGPVDKNDSSDRNDLAKMETAEVQIKGQKFQVWLARSPREQELGLMHVPESALAPLPDGTERGMLFTFPAEHILSFWMLNTIAPLDIVYIRGDGTIVRKYTMAPLETRLYPSVEPALMALEVRAGLFEQLGIGPGDRVEIPETLLKPAQ